MSSEISAPDVGDLSRRFEGAFGLPCYGWCLRSANDEWPKDYRKGPAIHHQLIEGENTLDKKGGLETSGQSPTS